MKLILFVKDYLGRTIHVEVIRPVDPAETMITTLLPTDLKQGVYSYKIIKDDVIIVHGTYQIN